MKTFKLIISLLVALFCVNAQAGVYNPNTLPVDSYKLTFSRVVNPDNILSAGTISAVDTILLHLQEATGVEALIIVVENIENDDPYSFSIEVGKKLGVGNKDNTGLVLTLATLDRSYYIVTGPGLDGTLPDAICKRIENRVMVPELKEGDWDDAILKTVATLSEYIQGNEELHRKYDSDDDDFTLFDLLLALGTMFGPAFFILFFTWYERWQRSKCDQCNHHSLKLLNRNVEELSGHRLKCVEHWHCKHCGNDHYRTVVRKKNDHYGNHGPFSGGPIIMGGGNYGGHSSPMSGPFGGFGGGTFHGGGAGGRF